MIRASLSRAYAAFLLATYVATGGVALWGEVQVETAADVPIHVEEAGRHPCDLGHDHGSCLVCRSLTSLGTPAGAGITALPGKPTAAPPPARAAVAPASGGLRLPDSRAPPVLRFA